MLFILGLRELLPNGSLWFPPFGARDYNSQIHQQEYRSLYGSPLGGTRLQFTNPPKGVQVTICFLPFGSHDYNSQIHQQAYRSLCCSHHFKHVTITHKSTNRSAGHYVVPTILCMWLQLTNPPTGVQVTMWFPPFGSHNYNSQIHQQECRSLGGLGGNGFYSLVN